jgi:hypothetical protein
MIVMVIVMGLVLSISSFSSPKYRSKLISRNLNQKTTIEAENTNIEISQTGLK